MTELIYILRCGTHLSPTTLKKASPWVSFLWPLAWSLSLSRLRSSCMSVTTPAPSFPPTARWRSSVCGVTPWKRCTLLMGNHGRSLSYTVQEQALRVQSGIWWGSVTNQCTFKTLGFGNCYFKVEIVTLCCFKGKPNLCFFCLMPIQRCVRQEWLSVRVVF